MGTREHFGRIEGQSKTPAAVASVVFEFDAQWYCMLRRIHQAEDDLPCAPAVVTLVDLASDGERASGDEKLEVLSSLLDRKRKSRIRPASPPGAVAPRVVFNQSTITLATTFCVVRCSYCMSRSVPESVPTDAQTNHAPPPR